MPPDLTIRAARPTDAEAIAAMQSLPGFRHGTLRPPYVSPDAVRKYLETQDNTQHLVATINTTIIGQISLHPFTGRRAHAATIGIGIHDDWTGQGIGSRLMTEIISIADNWLGLRRLELTVQTDNTRAIKLYQLHNFKIEGTHTNHSIRNGTLIDTHCMARLIPAPERAA